MKCKKNLNRLRSSAENTENLLLKVPQGSRVVGDISMKLSRITEYLCYTNHSSSEKDRFFSISFYNANRTLMPKLRWTEQKIDHIINSCIITNCTNWDRSDHTEVINNCKIPVSSTQRAISWPYKELFLDPMFIKVYLEALSILLSWN